MVNKQDFINAFEQNIDIVRGNSLCFNFQLTGLGSLAAYVAFEVDLNVSENYNDSPVFGSSLGDGITLENYDTESDTATYSVFVAPSKTKDLELARYYYALNISNSANVVTLMRGRFTLVYNVPKEGEQ